MKYYNLVKYQFRKKSNIFTIIIIGIAISIIVVLYSYLTSLNNYINSDIYDKITYRTLLVDYGSNSSSDEAKEELEGINHIVNVSSVYAYQTELTSDELTTESLAGEVWIYNANNDTLPEIILGTDFPDDDGYYMVCPENFYTTTYYKEILSLTKKDAIDIESYLNKYITFRYYGNMYFETGSDEYVFDIDILLVGIYKNSDYNIDEYVCYVNSKVLEDIAINVYKDDVDSITLENNIDMQEGLVVEVDDAQNVADVKLELESLGYTYSEMAYIDTAYINTINSNITLICAVIAGLILVFIYIILLKDYREDKEYYYLLYSLGYNKKTIRVIYFISNLLKVLFCFVISLVIVFIVILILRIILNIYPYLIEKYRVVIAYNALIIILILLVLGVIISTLVNLIKVGNYD